MIISILGVLKSGAAYLPLDPDYPVERLFFMLKDSNAKRLITTREIYDRLLREQDAAHVEFISASGSAADNLSHALLLDDTVVRADLKALSNAPITDRDRIRASTLDNLAYVIYTSGTTGKPKGVGVKRGAFINLLFWYL
jgi:non-ribosomal peptide synthetase component F